MCKSFQWILLLILYSLADGYQAGYTLGCPSSFSSGVTPGHGSIGSGPFELVVKDSGGSTVTSYDASATYTVTIQSTSTTALKGFIIRPLLGGSVTDFSGTVAGTLTIGAGNTAYAQSVHTSCSNAYTHTFSMNGAGKTSISFAWSPPDYGTGSVTFWAIGVACKTCTHSQMKVVISESATSSRKPSASASITRSMTPSASITGSLTRSASVSASETQTSSLSPSFSQSISISSSASITMTVSPSATETLTRSASPSTSSSGSRTMTQSATLSISQSGSSTVSVSPSVTASETTSTSATVTLSSTPTTSASASITSSFSASSTQSPSRSASGTATATCSLSFGATPSGTGSLTASSTGTPTFSASSSLSPSASPSVSSSATPSISTSPSVTASQTTSPSSSLTATVTNSVSLSASVSPTASVSTSFSITPTGSLSGSVTATATATTTSSASASATLSATGSLTATPTVSPAIQFGILRSRVLRQSPRLELRWKVAPNSLWMQLESATKSWLGFARSGRAVMLSSTLLEGGSDVAVLGDLKNNLTRQVQLTGYDASQFTAVADGTVLSADLDYSYNSSFTQTRLTVLRDTTSPSWQSVVAPNAVSGWIYAQGISDEVAYHGNGNGYVALVLNPLCIAAVTCGGRGVCVEDACACRVGYQGDTCASCVAGFTKNATGFCSPIASFAAPASISLQVNRTYSSLFPNSIALDSFKVQFRDDLAAVLGIESARINVRTLSDAGQAVRIDFLISAATTAQAPSAAAAAVALESHLQDLSSPLWETSTASLLSMQQPVSFSPEDAFTFSVSVSSLLTISWRRDAALKLVRFRLDFVTASSSWYGLGFNDDVNMIGTKAFVYEPGSNAVTQYSLQGRSVAEITSAGSIAASLITATATGHAVVFDISDALVSNIMDSDITIVYVAGQPGETSISRHAMDDDHVGGGTLSLASGTFSRITARRRIMQIAHGAIMFVVWNILIPAGIFAARYCKTTMKTPGRWFTIHRACQLTSVAFLLAAAVIAIASVPEKEHGASVHTVLGLAIVVVALLQPLNGILRPHKPEPGEKPSRGRICWEYFHKSMGYGLQFTAIIGCFLGLIRIGGSSALLGAYAAWVIVGLVIFMSAEIAARRASGKRSALLNKPPAPADDLSDPSYIKVHPVTANPPALTTSRNPLTDPRIRVTPGEQRGLHT